MGLGKFQPRGDGVGRGWGVGGLAIPETWALVGLELPPEAQYG